MGNRAWLLVVAVCLLGAAPAQATVYIHNLEPTVISAGTIDPGEIHVIPQVHTHDQWVDFYRGQSGFQTWSLDFWRRAQLDGTPTQQENGAPGDNFHSYSLSTANNSDIFCPVEQAVGIQQQANRCRGDLSFLSESGNIDTQVALSSTNCQPGIYKFRITVNGTTKEFERTYGRNGVVIATFPVLFKDQFNSFVQGATLAFLVPSQHTSTVSNAAGQASIGPLQAGNYEYQVSAPGCQTVAGTLDTGISGTINITMERTSGPPSDPNKANLIVTVVDDDTGTAISGATVSLGGVARTTDSAGKVTFTGVSAGAAVVAVTKSSYQGGNVTVQLVGGSTRKVTVKLSNDGEPPVADDDPEEDSPGFWEGLFKRLFVPDESTVKKWADLQGTMGQWGPFSLFNTFWSAFNATNIDGQEVMHWHWVPNTLAGTQMPFCIDLRPYQAAGYGDGEYGTQIGTTRVFFRQVIGWFTWIVFVWALVKWVKPRITV